MRVTSPFARVDAQRDVHYGDSAEPIQALGIRASSSQAVVVSVVADAEQSGRQARRGEPLLVPWRPVPSRIEMNVRNN